MRRRKVRGATILGRLIEGRWSTDWYDTSKTGGRFVRDAAPFRNWVTADGSLGPTGGGGFAAAIDGKIIATLPLAVGGLMSAVGCEETAARSLAMKKALHEIGLPMENPLLRIATLALPVIPEAKFSDLGLVDVMNKKLLPIFPGAK